MKAHGDACVPGAAAPAGTMPSRAAATEPDTVSSKLVGEFRGWEKGTVLKLANGQSWEVRDDEPFIASRSNAPAVTVERSHWRLAAHGRRI